MHSKRPVNVGQAMHGKQRVCAPLSCMPGTFHGGVRGGVAKALPVCNSIKKELKGLWGGWGCSMCDGDWGLVCPEALEAAAA